MALWYIFPILTHCTKKSGSPELGKPFENAVLLVVWGIDWKSSMVHMWVPWSEFKFQDFFFKLQELEIVRRMRWPLRLAARAQNSSKITYLQLDTEMIHLPPAMPKSDSSLVYFFYILVSAILPPYAFLLQGIIDRLPILELWYSSPPHLSQRHPIMALHLLTLTYTRHTLNGSNVPWAR
jgi:hypothetical protein